MRINPCHGCPLKKECDLHLDFRQRAKGVGARTVSFRCGRIVEMIPPGTRITMSMSWLDEDGGGWGPVIRQGAMKATVLTIEDDATFAAVMDRDEDISDDKFRFRKKKHVRNIIEFLDEPPATICKRGNVMLDENTCDHSNDQPCWCAEEKAFPDA